jgi:peptidylprolyl isomerase
MTRVRIWSLVALAASAFGLAACGGSSSPASTTTTTSAAGAGSSSALASIPAADRSPAGTAGVAPTITVPSGNPPTQLEKADLITGSGPAAEAGDSLTVEYVLATYSSRMQIQSSWSSQPLTFTLGVGQVIPGWDKGLAGMQAGGRRELIIPPSLGYGAQSPGAGIAANDTLVFIVDLQKIG